MVALDSALGEDLQHFADVQVDGAMDDAAAAADAINVPHVFHGIGEFVHDALAHALLFVDARIMTGSVQRKEGILTGIPGTQAHAFAFGVNFVVDIKTMAGGA